MHTHSPTTTDLAGVLTPIDGVLYDIIDWYEAQELPGAAPEIARLRECKETGLFVSLPTVLDMLRRLWCRSTPQEFFCWVHPDGGTLTFATKTRFATMLPDVLGGASISVLWSAPVRETLLALRTLYVEDRGGKDPAARAKAGEDVTARTDKALLDALQRWMLRHRQASGVAHTSVDAHAEDDIAMFTSPTSLSVTRTMRRFVAPDVDPLTAEMVAQDYFIGDDPGAPRMPGGYDLVDMLAAARFAPDRRQAYVWLQANAGFGKGMLLGALGALDLTVGLSQKAAEDAISGKPLGVSPDVLGAAWVVVFNEFSGLKREIKELENTMRCRPLYGGEHQVAVYAKLFLSAEDNTALTGLGGVEEQYADRFSYLLPRHDPLDDHPLLNALGRGVYRQALTAWIAERLWSHVEWYRALGPEVASKVAERALRAFWEQHKLGAQIGSLSETLPEHAHDFIMWAYGAWARGEHHAAGFDVLRSDGKAILVRPAKAFTKWLSLAGHDPAFRATLGKRRAQVLDMLGYQVHRVGDQTFRGCAVPLPEEAEKISPAVRRLGAWAVNISRTDERDAVEEYRRCQ